MKQSKSPRKKPALCLASTARGWRGIHPASPPTPQSLVSGTEGQPPPSTFQLSKESLLRDGPENRGNGFTGKEEKICPWSRERRQGPAALRCTSWLRKLLTPVVLASFLGLHFTGRMAGTEISKGKCWWKIHNIHGGRRALTLTACRQANRGRSALESDPRESTRGPAARQEGHAASVQRRLVSMDHCINMTPQHKMLC